MFRAVQARRRRRAGPAPRQGRPARPAAVRPAPRATRRPPPPPPSAARPTTTSDRRSHRSPGSRDGASPRAAGPGSPPDRDAVRVHNPMTLRLCAVLTAAFALTVPAAAQARDLLDTTITASTAQDRDCTTRLLGTKAQPTAKLTAPAGGWLTARLEADGPATGTSRASSRRPAASWRARRSTARSGPRRASSAPARRSRSRPAAAAARPPRPCSTAASPTTART